MIVEFGHYALVMALIVALAQSVVPMVGAARHDVRLTSFGRQAAFIQMALLLLSFAALTYAFVTSDFTLDVVVSNSHSLKPMLYKVSGVWGNHEGSMLLWVLILAIFGAAVAGFGRNLPESLRAHVLGVQGMIGVGFLLFIILTSNPFDRSFPAPLDGRDLNPLLQDPGLAFHPPFLYLGYVGLSVAFSFAVAALIEGKVDAAWARWVRPWTLAAWSSLTLGIALGSWWAYYELGWGGWWFWDPVENASFMPWLAATALLHSAIVVEKRDALKSWTVLLAILAFSLSLMGTFIVRSGVLTSVHAFAVDPERGIFILILLGIAVGGSLTLYAWRAPQLAPGGLFKPISREGGLLVNNLFLAVSCTTVLLGTLYPLIAEAVGAGKISVGPPFFNATFIPLMAPLVLLMAVGPMLGWKRAGIAGLVNRLKAALAATAVAAILVLFVAETDAIAAALGVAAGVWVLAGVATDVVNRVRSKDGIGASFRRLFNLQRAVWGTALGHAGVAVVVMGITVDSLMSTDIVAAARPGDQFELAGRTLVFEGVEARIGPNYASEFGTFTIYDGEKVIGTLNPERRRYLVQTMTTTEAAIRSTAFEDLYAVIGEQDQLGRRTVRLYHNPLVPWLWFGSIMMVLGGFVSLTDRRLRVGAPIRSSKPAPLPAPQPQAGD